MAVMHFEQVHATIYATRVKKALPKFMVVGHRGHGMNILQSPDNRMKAFKENSILSFNKAANHPLDFIEFDVQVTKDHTPIIFHDNFIITQHNGNVVERRVTDLSLDEFLSYGPQRDRDRDRDAYDEEEEEVGKSLLRKSNGKIVSWDVEIDDHSCTLQEAFEKVNPRLGFNIELKFDDYLVYEQDYLIHVVQVILKVVYDHAQERPVIFSTFQPDVALLIKKLQHQYPVYFLTNGGNEVYNDVRMNSLEEAKKVAISGGLDGVVSEVRGVFRNPSVVREIKESNLSLLTYGKLNNIPEAVHVQYLMGVEGVIVDLVEEITGAVAALKTELQVTDKIELPFLLSLISKLIQQSALN